MSEPHHRLAPPFWRHDWYTLSRLRDALRAVVRRDLRALPPGSILDLGAGDAPYKPLFTSLGRPYLCADLGDDAAIPISSGQPVPLEDESVALVVSFQVLEHVWDLDWYLGQCWRLLAPDGRLVLSTHGTWLYHPHPTDFRRWTRDGLERELEERGFEVLNTKSAVGPLAWTTQFRALGFHQVMSRIPVIGNALAAPFGALFNAQMLIEDRFTPRSMRANNAAIYIVVARKKAP